MATTDHTLDDNAAKPLQVKTAMAEVKQHSLPDQIQYETYKSGKAARASRRGPLTGLRIARAIPGGTVGKVSSDPPAGP